MQTDEAPAAEAAPAEEAPTAMEAQAQVSTTCAAGRPSDSSVNTVLGL